MPWGKPPSHAAAADLRKLAPNVCKPDRCAARRLLPLGAPWPGSGRRGAAQRGVGTHGHPAREPLLAPALSLKYSADNTQQMSPPLGLPASPSSAHAPGFASFPPHTPWPTLFPNLYPHPLSSAPRWRASAPAHWLIDFHSPHQPARICLLLCPRFPHPCTMVSSPRLMNCTQRPATRPMPSGGCGASQSAGRQPALHGRWDMRGPRQHGKTARNERSSGRAGYVVTGRKQEEVVQQVESSVLSREKPGRTMCGWQQSWGGVQQDLSRLQSGWFHHSKQRCWQRRAERVQQEPTSGARKGGTTPVTRPSCPSCPPGWGTL